MTKEMQKRKPSKLLYLVFLIIIFTLPFISSLRTVSDLYDAYRFYSIDLKARGTIISQKIVSCELGTSYRNIQCIQPIIKFASGDNIITFINKNRYFATNKLYYVGNTVDLLYNKNNPSDAIISHDYELWTNAFWNGFLAAFYTIIAYWILTAAKKHKGGLLYQAKLF